MADTSTVQTLIVGAMGGAITMAVKYAIDRFAESHKAEIGVRAKRRERYYDKQATAIAWMYERLARLVYAVDQLHISADPEHRRLVMKITTKNIKEALPAALEAVKEAEVYFATNELYFSESLANNVSLLILNMCMATGSIHRAVQDGLDQITEDNVRSIDSSRQRTRTVIAQLRTEFRKLMLGEERSSQSSPWAWAKSLRRSRPHELPAAGATEPHALETS